MKIKKFQAVIRKNKQIPGPDNMGTFKGIQLRKFPGTLI